MRPNRSSSRSRLRRLCTLLPLLVLLWQAGVGCLAALELVPSEYQVKAAFLLNFGKFIRWPARDFAGPSAPLVIGVLGDNPFQDDLKYMIAGKTIQGHPLVFRALTAMDGVRNCHILFVTGSARKQAPAILASLHGAAVLTVTENMPHFMASGFTVNFVNVRNHIRFEINHAVAVRSGLTISSKLLALALKPDP